MRFELDEVTYSLQPCLCVKHELANHVENIILPAVSYPVPGNVIRNVGGRKLLQVMRGSIPEEVVASSHRPKLAGFWADTVHDEDVPRRYGSPQGSTGTWIDRSVDQVGKDKATGDNCPQVLVRLESLLDNPIFNLTREIHQTMKSCWVDISQVRKCSGAFLSLKRDGSVAQTFLCCEWVPLNLSAGVQGFVASTDEIKYDGEGELMRRICDPCWRAIQQSFFTDCNPHQRTAIHQTLAMIVVPLDGCKPAQGRSMKYTVEEGGFRPENFFPDLRLQSQREV